MDKDEKNYREYLREIYGDKIIICGLEYDTAYAFKEIDPIAYDVGFVDWSSTF